MKPWGMAILLAGMFWCAGGVAAGFVSREPATAPALLANDLRGVPHTLAQYRGKVVLLNFWASWCPPCLREMPSMERLRTRMAGRPLEIVAVASAESAADVNAFLAKMKLEFQVLLDPDGSNTQRWKVFALPTSFLLDAEGRVRYVLTGPTEWDEGEGLQLIEALLAEPAIPAN